MYHSLAVSLLQAPIESSPLIVALLALLAIPGVTSALTGVLKSISGAVPSETVVYLVSMALTGAVMLMAGDALPGVDLLNPAGTVAAWLVWAKVNSSNAQVVYDLLKRWLGLIPSGPIIP